MTNTNGNTRHRRAVINSTSTGSGGVRSADTVQVVVVSVVLVGDTAIDSLQDGTLGQVVLVAQNVVISTFLVGVVVLDITSMTPLSDNSTLCQNIELTREIPNVLGQIFTGGLIQTGTVKQNADLAESSLVHNTNTVVIQLAPAIGQAIVGNRTVTSCLNSGISIASDSVVQAQGVSVVTLLGVVSSHVLVTDQRASTIGIGQAGGVANNSVEASEGRGNVSDGVVDTLIKSTSTRAATQLGQQGAVSTDAGCAGIYVELSTQATGRASQVTSQNGTETSSQTNIGVTVVPDTGSAVLGVQAVFELEDSLQAVAQIFNTLETDVGRVGGYAVTVVVVRGVASGSTGSLDAVEGSISNTVDGNVGLSESSGRSQTSDGQSDNLLIQPRVPSMESIKFLLYFK